MFWDHEVEKRNHRTKISNKYTFFTVVNVPIKEKKKFEPTLLGMRAVKAPKKKCEPALLGIRELNESTGKWF